MYVPSKDVKPALQQKLLVQPKQDITQFERTNLWTVCLTTSGVVNYLNRKISPLGDYPCILPMPAPASRLYHQLHMQQTPAGEYQLSGRLNLLLERLSSYKVSSQRLYIVELD